MNNYEFLKAAYTELSIAIMYRNPDWKLLSIEESLLSMVFPVDYLFEVVYPNIKFISMGDALSEEKINENLDFIKSSKLFDKLLMPLTISMFKKHTVLVKECYQDFIETSAEYQRYYKTLENKVLSLYVGENVAFDIAVALKKIADGSFPAWNIIFTNPISSEGMKPVKTVAGIYKIIESNQSREWYLSKLLNEL